MSSNEVYFIFELAILLGVSRNDIRYWISSGKLVAESRGERIVVPFDSLVECLRENRECVGRIYCDDMPSHINHFRSRLVKKVEEVSYA